MENYSSGMIKSFLSSDRMGHGKTYYKHAQTILNHFLSILDDQS